MHTRMISRCSFTGVKGWLVPLFESFFIFVLHFLLFQRESLVGALPVGVDGFYHYAMATMHSWTNLAQDVDFLPYTYLGTNPVNHHWLFHWALKPLTYLPENAEYSIANAAAVWGALLPALLNLILRFARVPFAPLVAIFAVWAAVSLPARYLMFRAQNLALLFLVLLHVLGARKKYLFFAIALFFFSQSYQAAVLVFFVVFSIVLTDWFINREFNTRIIFASVLGFGLSLILSPWFPGNVEFFVFHLLFLIWNPYEIYQINGVEWRPLRSLDFFRMCYPALASLAIAVIALWKSSRQRPVFLLAISFFMLAVFFGFMSLNHVRFIEFFGPMSVIAMAVSLAAYNENSKRVAIHSLLALSLVGLLSISTLSLEKFSTTSTIETYQGHCKYIRQNLRPGATIFNASEWSTFSILFKCLPGTNFVVGLDGNMLAYGDKDVFRIWYMFYAGQFESVLLSPQLVDEVLAVFDKTNTQFVVFSPKHMKSAVRLSDAIAGLEFMMGPNNNFLLIYAP